MQQKAGVTLVALGAAAAVACVLLIAKVVTPGLDALISPSRPPFMPRTPRFSAEHRAARPYRGPVLPTTKRRRRNPATTENRQKQTAHALASARQAISSATVQLRAALKHSSALTTARAISAAKKAISGATNQIRAALKQRRARITAHKPSIAGAACLHCWM